MLRARIFPLFCGLCLCASAYADDQDRHADEHEKHARAWDLPNDLLTTSNQISFRQGARAVWYFMESASFTHDPILYGFLPDYEAVCQIDPTQDPEPETVPGLPCWKRSSHPTGLPQADLNVTGRTQVRHDVAFPPHSLAIHPSPISFAIVAWKSPIRGKVDVNGSFTDLNPSCGNGVIWTIDQGATTLASGEVNSSSDSFNLPHVRVARGQVLYFIVDPKDGDYFCDSTQLKLTIATQETER